MKKFPNKKYNEISNFFNDYKNEVFESLDDESLALIAQNDPEQLQRMCMFLSLDQQKEKEKITPRSEIN